MIKQAIREHKPFVVLLHGELGSGKTTFVAKTLRKIMPRVRVTSPSFTIINSYAPTVFHVDLYRIKDEKELHNTDFFEILHGDNIVFIEHPYNCVRPSEYTNIKYGISIEFAVVNGRHKICFK
jgi:tRNA threonylcarbamoyladenosine biosynthesis protein TsaE